MDYTKTIMFPVIIPILRAELTKLRIPIGSISDMRSSSLSARQQGGITSSDMATKGLGFKRAMVVGQAAPGVPLWRCDEATSKWTGIPYVVFPGNVGSDETLYEVVDRWRPART